MPALPLRRRQMMTKGEVISNPGRRLVLCVAPYFADRGVGDMRGPPNGVPNMPPRRRWQAVIAPHNDVLHKMIHATPRCKRQPRTTSGVRLRSSDLARPACRRHHGRRNTGLRTAATTSGVAEMLASGHRLRRGGDADAANVGNVERGTLFALWRAECANSGGYLRLG